MFDKTVIWNLGSGSQIVAAKDMIMAETRKRAFTSGVTYTVSTMHPLADPPYIVVIDDQRQAHRLAAQDLREYFTISEENHEA